MKRRDFLKYCAALPLIGFGGIDVNGANKDKELSIVERRKKESRIFKLLPRCEVCKRIVWVSPYAEELNMSPETIYTNCWACLPSNGSIKFLREIRGHKECIINCDIKALVKVEDQEKFTAKSFPTRRRVEVVGKLMNKWCAQQDDYICISNSSYGEKYYERDLVKVWSIPFSAGFADGLHLC